MALGKVFQMTTNELKAWALEEAERVARGHSEAGYDCCIAVYKNGYACNCGRDAEVQVIAAAIEAAYARGVADVMPMLMESISDTNEAVAMAASILEKQVKDR